MALQSIWWRDISKDPLFEPLQAKFQPERTHSSRLVVIWSEIGAQKSALPSRQRAIPQVDRCNDKTMNWLWIDSSSTLFSGFGPVWLLSVPKLKNLTQWEEILIKWRTVNEYIADFETAYFKWLLNVNYASFLAEIWPEGVRRVDLSRCRVIKWIIAPFHGNLPNLSNDSRRIESLFFSALQRKRLFFKYNL